MHYTIIFKVKGELKSVISSDKDAMLTICAAFDLCHLPYQLFHGRAILLSKGSLS